MEARRFFFLLSCAKFSSGNIFKKSFNSTGEQKKQDSASSELSKNVLIVTFNFNWKKKLRKKRKKSTAREEWGRWLKTLSSGIIAGLCHCFRLPFEQQSLFSLFCLDRLNGEINNRRSLARPFDHEFSTVQQVKPWNAILPADGLLLRKKNFREFSSRIDSLEQRQFDPLPDFLKLSRVNRVEWSGRFYSLERISLENLPPSLLFSQFFTDTPRMYVEKALNEFL